MLITQNLAQSIVSSDIKSMTAELIVQAKRSFLDLLGVMLAGSASTEGRAFSKFMNEYSGENLPSHSNSSLSSSVLLRAYHLAVLSHILDYDDVGAGTQGHPSAVLIPVALTLADDLAVSGPELLESYVVGLEAWSKLSGIVPGLHLKGWHPTGMIGTIGAAATAAKIMKLTLSQTAMALGIACSGASGMIVNFGTITKALHSGNAAYNGIMSALLARSGFIANKNALDGKNGFCAVLNSDDVVASPPADLKFGSPYSILFPGITLKKYPSCAHTHRLLDGALYLIEKHNISASKIQSVICWISPAAKKVLFYESPNTVMEAKFSLPYTISAAIINRKFNLVNINEQSITNPEIKKLMNLIEINVHKNWDIQKDNPENKADRIQIKLHNGKVFSKDVLRAKGHPKNPMTYHEVISKFKECTGTICSNSYIDNLFEICEQLEMADHNRIRELYKIVLRNTNSTMFH